jgi:lysophospholipase L1-like esterase
VRSFFAALAFASAVSAQMAPADKPAPRVDRNSQLAHEDLLAKAKAGGVDIYFEGDSIVRRWGATDYPQFLANWKENFFGWNAGDFGWGADRVENILWRLENGELDGVNPKVFVLLAGTNNVGNRVAPDVDAAAANVIRGLQAVVNAMRGKAPGAVIILTAIFPRNDNVAVLPEIAKINAGLRKMADDQTIRYLDINDKLADADGKLYEGMLNARDKLHPQLRGYQVWADALKPIFTELLGPPAATDHAPPPTGDPSAPRRNSPAPPVTRP